jgi:proline iminopeptidase
LLVSVVSCQFSDVSPWFRVLFRKLSIPIQGGTVLASMEAFIDVDGVRLRTTTSGDGQPLLPCHGGPGQWDYFEPVADLVDDLVTVHRYDQRGCGRSSPGGPYTVSRYVEDIEALRRPFGHDSRMVGGHSWGATLALAYAWQHPERVDAVFYVSGVGLGSEWRQAYRTEGRRRLTSEQHDRYLELRGVQSRSAAEELEYLSLGAARDFADRATALEKARQHYEGGFAVNMKANGLIGAEVGGWIEGESVARCRNLHIPTLVVHGELDPRPSWGGDSLCDALPDVRRVVIGGAGHLPWVEQPKELRDALRSFLEERVLA